MRIDQIETDTNYIDYASLVTTMKMLKDQLAEMEKEQFLGTYYARLGFYAKTWRTVELRYLIAMLEYLNPDFSYNKELRIGKTIVANEHSFQEIMKGNHSLLDQLENHTPSAFRKYGFLLG